MNTSELTAYLAHLQGVPLALSCYTLLKRTERTQDKNDEVLKALLSAISSAETSVRVQSIRTSVQAAQLDVVQYGAGPVLKEMAKRLKEKEAVVSKAR